MVDLRQRRTRRIRSGPALLELVYDEGWLRAPSAGAAAVPLHVLCIGLRAGPLPPLLALAERWRRRFGLLVEPRSAAERMQALSQDGPAPRRARRPAYGHGWHARIAADVAFSEVLDEPAVHALRRRIERQRYAVEFFAPVLPGRHAEPYLKALAEVQAAMGTLNDLYVARARYQALVADDNAAWLALGWLSARIAEARAAVLPRLSALAGAAPPRG